MFGNWMGAQYRHEIICKNDYPSAGRPWICLEGAVHTDAVSGFGIFKEDWLKGREEG